MVPGFALPPAKNPAGAPVLASFPRRKIPASYTVHEYDSASLHERAAFPRAAHGLLGQSHPFDAVAQCIRFVLFPTS